jgi:thiol-disulfide isomerase/thioredoxin
MRILTFLVALVLCAAASARGVPETDPQHDPQLIDAQGYQRLLDQYRGKPVLITFWATWCEPCRDEYPMLNELAKQYAPKGLRVVGVNLDGDGDLILMRRFIARYKPAFPNYRKKPGGESAFLEAVLPGWQGELPASFFYAKDGRQIGHLLGARNRDTYEAAIGSLLAADTGAAAALPAKYKVPPARTFLQTSREASDARHERQPGDLSRSQRVFTHHAYRAGGADRSVGDHEPGVPGGAQEISAARRGFLVARACRSPGRFAGACQAA